MIPEVLVRVAEEADMPFIRAGWIRTFRHSPFAADICDEVYYPSHDRLMSELLEKSRLLVACSNVDSWQLFGFVCGEMREAMPVLHYAYVKQLFRRLGIARSMLAGLWPEQPKRWVYTHSTKTGKMLGYRLGGTFTPYLLRGI